MACFWSRYSRGGFEDYRKALQSRFKRVVSRKPAASRARSTEVYQLGFGLK